MSNDNPFTGPQLDNAAYEKASMVNSRFNGVNLKGATFFAVISDATFGNCNMHNVEFDDVNMSDSRFNNINLSGTTFSNINFSNVEISDANLQGMKINGILVTDLLNKYES